MGICGLVNGLLVQIVKIPAFYRDTRTGYIIFGIAQIVSNGSAITNLPEHVLAIARGEISGNIQYGLHRSSSRTDLLVCALHKSTYGRTLMSAGLNIKASRLSESGRICDSDGLCHLRVCSALAAVLDGDAVVNNRVPTLRRNGIHFPGDNGGDSGEQVCSEEWEARGSVLGVMTIYIIENRLGLLGVNYYMRIRRS